MNLHKIQAAEVDGKIISVSHPENEQNIFIETWMKFVVKQIVRCVHGEMMIAEQEQNSERVSEWVEDESI